MVLHQVVGQLADRKGHLLDVKLTFWKVEKPWDLYWSVHRKIENSLLRMMKKIYLQEVKEVIPVVTYIKGVWK